MYNHKEIEKKWQKYWEENKTFKIENNSNKPKFYCLDMFPYPSGAGLHVGHPEGMTANDIIARYKNAKWFNVLHPIWWDAFWLPAENYAIKTGTHPRITTDENINNFRKQIKSLGFSYDWDREIDTTDPKYYKWTQWIFLKLFEKGLAYEQDLPINYCPSCKTGLANEEVLNNFTCERCGEKVEKKKIRQWVLAITKYADRLERDVDKLDWPEGIKEMQKNWIWKSQWCEFQMKKTTISNPSPHTSGLPLEKEEIWKISVYTTRIDTVFGMTYTVLAPDHKDVGNFITPKQKEICEKYILEASKKSDQDRTQDDKEKTWVFTWSYVINPFNQDKIPLWIADYVLWNYWTWAVMAVPAHDERDFEFAKKYDLKIKESISWGNISEKAFTNLWILVNSWEFTWLTSKEAQEKMIKYAEDMWFWKKKINYKLRDWLFSRQRYWGEPIPLIHLENKDVKKLEKIKTQKNENCSPEGVVTLKRKPAKFSSTYIILENIIKVKRKNNKKDLSSIYNKKKIWNKSIIFDWKKLKKHFKNKNSKELFYRSLFGLTISKNLDKLIYEWELIWYLKIKNDIFRIILENIWKNEYVIKTYYSTLRYTKLFNKAYIKQKWKEEYLWIKWKEYSKIYSWLYGKIICDYKLPLELPEVENFEPSGDGQSPLAKVDDFVKISLAENLTWKRETNTMPQWGWSCWYYLRYMNNSNDEILVDPDVEKYWGQVDSYVGWAEHAVLHLLYARFWHKFLFDIWVVSNNEPFQKLRNQWLILAHAFQKKNWWLIANDLVEEKWWIFYEISSWDEVNRIVSKMSKSLKNVVNPDDIVEQYWADSLRLYEMYMAEFKDTAPWDTKNIIWVKRFLEKAERLFSNKAKISNEDDNFTIKLLHKTIKKVEDDINDYKFNTAIASLMILVNNWLPKSEELQKIWKETFVILLHPFAPHLAEELWKQSWEKESIFFAPWPKYDEKLIVDDTLTIAVQILGKVRGTIEINKNEEKESVLQKAKSEKNVSKWLEWKELIKEIYVPWKIINFVVK